MKNQNVSTTHLLNWKSWFGIGIFCILFSTMSASSMDTLNCDASFTFTIDSITTEVFFFPNTIDSTLNYNWSFGDGTGSNDMFPSHTYNSFGPYTVCLQLLGDSCQAQSCVTIDFNNPPVGCDLNASYTFSVDSNNTVNFTNTSTGSFDVTNWTFGDGSTSNANNPSHTYTQPGTYSVCLNIFNTTDSCSSDYCNTIVIENNPTNCNQQAIFSYSLDQGNTTAHFTNASIGSYDAVSWSFGDGSGSNLENPSHTYAQAGTYTVCLDIYNSIDSCSSTTCSVISFQNTPPGCNPAVNFVFGNVSLANAPADYATVYLYSVADSGAYTLINTTSLIPGSAGSYSFNNVTCGPYIVQAHLTSQSSEFGNYFPTYHLSTTDWQSANQFMSTQTADIIMVPNDSIGGNGNINGQLTGLNNLNNSSATVVVLNSNGQPVAFGYLNLDGSFNISNLPMGTYSLYVELPGMISEVFDFSISSSSLEVSGVEIEVTSNGFVFTGVEEVVIHGIDQIGNVYPMPASQHASINIVAEKNMSITTSIFNLNGKEIQRIDQRIQAGNNQITIDFPELNSGMYLLQITFDGTQRYATPIVIQ